LTRRWVARALTALVLAGAVVLIAFLPRVTSEFRLGEFTYVAIYFIALLGLNILTGYNGQISLGHAAFMAVGGYTAAVLILGQEGFKLLGQQPSDIIPKHGMTPIWTIPVAGVVTGVIGYLFGLPALRLAGVSLALATFAVAVSMPSIAKRFEHLTGGGGGLSLPLPKAPFGWDISPPHWLYYEAWGAAGILFVVAWLLVRGRVGRAWRSIRDGEVAAVSSGVSPAVYKTLAFGISSAYAGDSERVHQPGHIPPDPVDPPARERGHRRAFVALGRDRRCARARVPADLRTGPTRLGRQLRQAGGAGRLRRRVDVDRVPDAGRGGRAAQAAHPPDRRGRVAPLLTQARPEQTMAPAVESKVEERGTF
jgi:ABC-type branched-subunit amino acid transport system permease subunit